MTTARCNGLTCDGRQTTDELCSLHGKTGQALWAIDHFARHDPDVNWPSDAHDTAIDAVLTAFDEVRERA